MLGRRNTTHNHIERETLRSTRYFDTTTNSRAMNETVSMFALIICVLPIILSSCFIESLFFTDLTNGKTA